MARVCASEQAIEHAGLGRATLLPAGGQVLPRNAGCTIRWCSRGGFLTEGNTFVNLPLPLSSRPCRCCPSLALTWSNLSGPRPAAAAA